MIIKKSLPVLKNEVEKLKKIYPDLKTYLSSGKDTLYRALKISATGNNIDSAIYDSLDFEHIVENELKTDFSICDIDIFKNKLCG